MSPAQAPFRWVVAAAAAGEEVGQQCLRQLLGPVSAALITGDTAPDRLREATHSGLPLLHKPLNARQLKTCLCQLLVPPAGAVEAEDVSNLNAQAV